MSCVCLASCVCVCVEHGMVHTWDIVTLVIVCDLMMSEYSDLESNTCMWLLRISIFFSLSQPEGLILISSTVC